MICAWAFYRRSTDLQEFSIEDQKKACRQFADENGWTVIKEFSPEKGYASGLTIDRDSQFLEMVRLAETTNHGATYIIVYDVSRFGRLDAEEKIYWEQRFKKQGRLQVVYVKDYFKNDGSIGDIVTKIVKHSEAHEYSVKLSQTTLRGCKSHSEMGHSAGGSAPYGYDRLLIDQAGAPVKVMKHGERKADKLQRIVWTKGSPATVAVLVSIFEDFANGIGMTKITDELNRKRISSPYNGQWAKGTVRAILKNPAYTGLRTYNVRSWKNRNKTGGFTNNPKSEWVFKEDAHPPLISKELFEKAQAIFKTRKPGAGKHHNNEYMLSGLVKCLHCGHNYQGFLKHHGEYKKRYYTCGGYVSKGREVCTCFSVPAQDVEDFALNEIKTRLNSPKVLDSIRSLVKAMLHEQEKTGNKNLAPLEAGVQNTKRQIQNLVEAVKEGRSFPALLDELAALEEQKKRLECDLAVERAKPTLKTDPEAVLRHVEEIMASFPKIMARGSNEQKKLALRNHIQRIEVNPAERMLTFHFYHIPITPNENAAGVFPGGVSSRASSLKDIAGGPQCPLQIPRNLSKSAQNPLFWAKKTKNRQPLAKNHYF